MKQSGDVGKAFIESSLALKRIAGGEQLQDYEKAFLRKAADALHDVEAWDRFCRGKGTCIDNTEIAQALHLTVSKASGGFGGGTDQVVFWSKVRTAACAMQSLADGGSCQRSVLLEGANICYRIGMRLMPPLSVRRLPVRRDFRRIQPAAGWDGG